MKTKKRQKKSRLIYPYSVREYAEKLGITFRNASHLKLPNLHKAFLLKEAEDAQRQILINRTEATKQAIITEEILQQNAKNFADTLINKANELVAAIETGKISNEDIIELAKVCAGFLVNMQRKQ